MPLRYPKRLLKIPISKGPAIVKPPDSEGRGLYELYFRSQLDHTRSTRSHWI